jgi:hypothetical protein
MRLWMGFERFSTFACDFAMSGFAFLKRSA